MLAGLLGIELRDVTKEVERLRKGGTLICASVTEPCGYFLPSPHDMTDVKRYHRQFSNRISEAMKSLQPFTDYLAAHGEL